MKGKIIPVFLLVNALFQLALFFLPSVPGNRSPFFVDRVFQGISLAGLIPCTYLTWKFVPGKIGVQGVYLILFSILQIISSMALEPFVGKISGLILFAVGVVLFWRSIRYQGY